MIKRTMIWLVCVLLLLAASGISAQTGTLTVDAAQNLGPINPYVYGSNLGLYGVIPPDLMPEAQALGITFLRFGGGESDRRDVPRSQVDLFMYQVRQLGAEPLLTVRLFNGTPEKAADMVRYTNIEKDYNIRYWSIGNEPNLLAGQMKTTYTTEEYNREWRAIAEAMLAVDPDILLVGPDITQYVILSIENGEIKYLERDLGGHALDAEGRDWLQEFLRANGDLVDVVSIHRYPYPGAGEHITSVATIESLREINKEWDVSIPNLRQIIREAAGRDLPIAVTEINSNSNNSVGGEATLESHYNAVWLADVLGRLIRQQVDIVAYWDMQGVERAWGLIERYGVRPTYYTYLLYTHFGTELLAAESSVPNVSIYAARREDGALTLMVVNLGLDEVTAPLEINGFTPAMEAGVWQLTPDILAEQLEPVDISAGITVPGQSVTLYVVQGA